MYRKRILGGGGLDGIPVYFNFNEGVDFMDHSSTISPWRRIYKSDYSYFQPGESVYWLSYPKSGYITNPEDGTFTVGNKEIIINVNAEPKVYPSFNSLTNIEVAVGDFFYINGDVVWNVIGNIPFTVKVSCEYRFYNSSGDLISYGSTNNDYIMIYSRFTSITSGHASYANCINSFNHRDISSANIKLILQTYSCDSNTNLVTEKELAQMGLSMGATIWDGEVNNIRYL